MDDQYQQHLGLLRKNLPKDLCSDKIIFQISCGKSTMVQECEIQNAKLIPDFHLSHEMLRSQSLLHNRGLRPDRPEQIRRVLLDIEEKKERRIFVVFKPGAPDKLLLVSDTC